MKYHIMIMLSVPQCNLLVEYLVYSVQLLITNCYTFGSNEGITCVLCTLKINHKHFDSMEMAPLVQIRPKKTEPALTALSSLDLEQVVSLAEDCVGILGIESIDICE